MGGEEIEADAVLANADLPYAYRELLGGSADGDFRLRKREKLEYTASAFMLYLGIDRKLDHMLHHNFYLSGRYRENFEAIFRDHVAPEDPSFYAVVPTEDGAAHGPARGKTASSSSSPCRTSELGWTGTATVTRSKKRSTDCWRVGAG